MSERNRDDIRLFLDDILSALDRIIRYTTDITYADFINDTKTQDAVIRNLEILGEAVKNLPEPFKESYPNVPWKQIAGMRDKLVHHYFGVSLEIVWETITHDIPKINLDLQKIRNLELK